MPLAELWGSAVAAARGGFEIDRRLSADLAAGAELLAADPEAAGIYLAIGPHPSPGAVLRNRELAGSLEAVIADRNALAAGELPSGSRRPPWARMRRSR